MTQHLKTTTRANAEMVLPPNVNKARVAKHELHEKDVCVSF